jgi:hypothetical protein
LYRLVGQRAEAEDLAVEVFWRLHKQMDSGSQGTTCVRGSTGGGEPGLERPQGGRGAAYEEGGNADFEDRAVRDPLEEAAQAERRGYCAHVSRLKTRSARLLPPLLGVFLRELAMRSAWRLLRGSLLARAEKEFEKNSGRERRSEPDQNEGADD